MRGLLPGLQCRRGHSGLIGNGSEAGRLRQRRFFFGDAVAGCAIGMRVIEAGLRVAGLLRSLRVSGHGKGDAGTERNQYRMPHG